MDPGQVVLAQEGALLLLDRAPSRQEEDTATLLNCGKKNIKTDFNSLGSCMRHTRPALSQFSVSVSVSVLYSELTM